jgi:hypothetical protein
LCKAGRVVHEFLPCGHAHLRGIPGMQVLVLYHIPGIIPGTGALPTGHGHDPLDVPRRLTHKFAWTIKNRRINA